MNGPFAFAVSIDLIGIAGVFVLAGIIDWVWS